MGTIPILTQLEYLLRIVVAMLCGGMIGLERERRVKSAGLKTHMIVSIGAALMMIISKYGFWDVLAAGDTVKLDPSRVAAGIVSAIGFLGAGIIFTRGFKISGVTTAAGLWTTVGVGMVLGAGMYFIGIVSTILVLIIQLCFYRIKINVTHPVVHVHIVATGPMYALDHIQKAAGEINANTVRTKFVELKDPPGQMKMDLSVITSDKNYKERFMLLFNYPGATILSMDFET
ncbi:MAG: MgtC/SapB family protein [Oscillospiraceae bacterium]|nr:MgtC/SapB family protein [Oscillospiraceae bacterium]